MQAFLDGNSIFNYNEDGVPYWEVLSYYDKILNMIKNFTSCEETDSLVLNLKKYIIMR